MGNIFGCIATGIGWCFCSATASLLGSCCGTDKASNIPPGANSGRKRSVFLLILSIGLSFLFQYGVALWLQPNDDNALKNYTPVGKYIVNSWLSGCEDYETVALQEVCSGQSGVYRTAGSAFLFFLLATIGVLLKPSANREAWLAKYTLFLFMIGGTIFIPNQPLFNPILLNIFRAGGVLFILLQQIILIDFCYNINDGMVEKANQAEADEGEGAGNKWLGILISISAVCFGAAITGIVLMYVYFGDCDINVAFVTVTLILGVISTIVQLMGEESSLLTSSSIFAYSTYLCYSAVTKNPNQACNPQLGKEDVGGIIIGISLALISLAWTGFSYTAGKAVGDESDDVLKNNEVTNENNQPVTGTVIDAKDDKNATNYGSIEEEEQEEEPVPNSFSNSWKLNIVLMLICCWYAMTLTSWGSVETGGNAANPGVGRISMWIIITSQWLMQLLYLWTLIAPSIFPDRDFS